MYERSFLAQLVRAFDGPGSVFHVLAGPRQVGKTTIAKQLIGKLDMPSVYASADAPLPPGPEWIETQWQAALVKGKGHSSVLLVLDEIQKVRGWNETLKRLWDQRDPRRDPIRLLALGSSVLMLRQGLAESLAGRFFLHRCSHWSFDECRSAFGWDLEKWLYFGGYPGAAQFVEDESQWKQYVSESLVETVLARDVLQMTRITKPALLRQLFGLAAAFPARVLSYNKMLGQLHDAGNTTTLAQYLRVMESAMLVSGLESFWRGRERKRGSSPKLILWNNALISALSMRSRSEAMQDRSWRGRLVENAVGAHLLNSLPRSEYSVSYWRKGDAEVDFVVSGGAEYWALEVKSGRVGKLTGAGFFRERYPDSRFLLVGGEGVPPEEFLAVDAGEWLR